MINSIVKIPDNISTSFEVVNGNFILGAPEPSYQSLDQTYIGSYVPYVAKNALLGIGGVNYEWEIGIGKVITTTVIDRIKVLKSSQNVGIDGFVQFTLGGTKTFSIFPNEYSSNIGFNNLIDSTGVINLSNTRSTVLVNLSAANSIAYLPAASGNEGLLIDFKSYNQNSNNSLTIVPSGSDQIDNSSELIVSDNLYTSLVSNGSGWIELKNEANINLSIDSIGLPQGENLSLQYKVASGELGGSNIYAVNSGLLIGSPNSVLAQHIFSNNGNNVINNKNLNVNFIVKGSGNKNLTFAPTGKLGLNIPSGYSPNSLLHLISSNCDASIKLENRNNCVDSIPSIILNHRPTTLISNNSTIGRLSYSAKNSAGTSTNYADIRSKALNTITGYTSGQLIFGVDDTGTTTDVMSMDKDKITFKLNNSILNIKNSTISGEYNANLNDIYCDNIIVNNLTGNNYVLYSNSSGLIYSSPIDVTTISISGHSHSIADVTNLPETISGIYTFSNNNISTLSGTLRTDIDTKIDISNPNFITGIISPYVISPDSNLIRIDLADQNFVGEWTKNDLPILTGDTSNPVYSGYILTHNGSSVAWKQFNPYNYIFDGIDIKWNKYLNKDCTILNGGLYININETNLSNEFSLGDTVKISINGDDYLRTIDNINIQNSITTFTINQSLPVVGSGNIFSISKGGYLELSVDPVTAPDISPKIILSSRPSQDTIFNSTQANIGFKVYGTNSSPILDINPSGNIQVNGRLYTNILQLGSNVVPSGYILTSSSGNTATWSPQTQINDLDGGIIVFSGVGVL